MARIPLPRPVRRPVLGMTASLLRMDLSEAERPLAEYASVDALFVRRLRPGVRRWPANPVVPGSPVDGVVGQSGRVRDGRALQAKGREYTVAELLDDAELADSFAAGSYVTLYLAPRHYHRIHAPVGGSIRLARRIPGRLLPVNGPAVRAVDRLFPRNERLVCVVEPGPASSGPASGSAVSGAGVTAVVAIGAFNVGRITADFDAGLITNRRGAATGTRVYDPALPVTRGQELMAFHLGSSVVLLFERPLPLAPDVEPGREIRLGAPLTGSDRAPDRAPDRPPDRAH